MKILQKVDLQLGSQANDGTASPIKLVPCHSKPMQGSALVIVLAFLVLITGLVVAFISSIGDEAATTAAGANAITTRNLANAAVQLTIAQIRDATTGFDATGNMVGWASQPGAIRTFPANFSSDTTILYKLYSAPVLRTNAAASNDLPGTGWWNKTALFVDLNSPVKRSSGGSTITNYPIMDPSMTNNPVSGVTNPVVDGFSINSTSSTLSGASNPAAMPVTWLYMLRNGTLIAPDSSSTTTATFTTAATQPSATNPIVGRIAFWTDDESCKLNINTASEGAPWDPPTYSSLEDMAAQSSVPAGNEYHRMPGHPFSVCLSPVLWSFFGLPHPAALVWNSPKATTKANYNLTAVGNPVPVLPSFLSINSNSATNYLNALFGKTNVTAGLISRTAPITSGSFFGITPTVTNNRLTFTTQTPKTDRLYYSVDELAFAATNSSTTRQTNSSPLTPNKLAGLRFFLTTSSKASEVNMFNLPRISLWPLNNTNAANTNTVNPYAIKTAGTARWSSVDKLMAMASTINGFPYYFTRYDPSDQTNDFTGRNVILYNYLANLLQSPIPGYSNSFSSRWGANATYETATVCFDYIRSCINTVDSYGTNTSGGDASSAAIRYAYSYTVPPTNTVSNTTVGGTANDPGINAFIPGLGQVVPIKIVANGITTRGIGRFPVLKSATLAFVAVAADQPPLMVDTITRKPLSPAQVNPLHPFPTTISASSVVTNGFWETVASKSLTISPGNTNNGNTNTYQVVSGNNQFPSWFPTNANVYYIAPGASISSFNSISNYVIQLGINPYFDFKFTPPSTVSTNTNYISYQVGSHSSLGISGGVTVTHPGLVYGGDLNTNTGAFDLYNAYFSTTAGLIPGLGTTNNSFTYTNQIRVTNSAGNLITNFTTAANPLPIANSASTLFPKPYQTVMQPVLILDYGLPSPGFAPYYANFKVRVTGLGNFKVDGTTFFGSGAYGDCNTNANPYSDFVGSCSGPEMSLADKNNAYANGVATGNWPFYGNFVKTSASSDPTGKTFAFTGGNLKIEFLKTSASYTTASSNDIIQTINLNFPSTTFPTPKLSPYNGMSGASSYYLFGTNDTSGNWVSGCPLNMPLAKYLFPSNSTIIGSDSWSKSFPYNALFLQDLGTNYNATANTFRSVEVTYGDWRLPAMMQTVPAATTSPSGGPSANSLYTINDSKALYTPHRLYFASSSEPGMAGSGYADGSFFWRSAHTLVGSAAESRMVPGTFLQGLNNANSYGGDPGMIYNLISSNSTWPKNLWDHLFLSDSGGNSLGYPLAGSTVDFTGNISSSSPFTSIWASGGDFDDPPGNIRSAGPFINKSDEGSAVDSRLMSPNKNWGSVGRTRFAPNLMVPSAGVLGSLPVGFDPANPSITNAWRTLLFCPNPNSPSHSSLGQMPPDYMIMDLFRMPVVQPYPLGDALATAGRVNLNYQIAPFTYIHRDSALRGVLKSVDIAAIRDDDGDVYKGPGTNALPSQFSAATNYYAYRFPVHLDQTLQQFDAKFATNGFFRSGAEICSTWLYPAVAPGDTASQQTNPAQALVNDTPGSTTSISNWWYSNPGSARKGMTGDNARERPYAGIYANVTTKSNVYQVHYRVQALKQTPTAHGSGNYATWIDPGSGGVSDKIVGELRGSVMVERFIDTSDPKIPDVAGVISSNGPSAVIDPSNSMNNYYSYRIFAAKDFTP